MDLTAFADEISTDGPVTISGLGTRGGPVADVRVVHPPSGIDWIQADEMTACCGAGTPVNELTAALAEVGQRTVLPDGGTVGGALAVGRSGIRRLGDGPMRDVLLQARFVGAGGDVVKAGGPTVKNVSGFDVCRLLVGSQGTLGFVGEVIVRTRPIAQHSHWFSVATADPTPLFASLYRPTSVLWDGVTVWVMLEGHCDDVAAQAAQFDLVGSDGPPPMPPQRRLVPISEQQSVCRGLEVGSFVAELGVGVVHFAAAVPALAPQPGVVAVNARVKHQFDPAGRLNPGLIVG